MIEKVNPQHPDKVADRIAGAIVDLAYERDENPKIAVEVLIGHSKATVIIESNLKFTKRHIKPILERIVGEVDLRLISVQQDPHLAENQANTVRCGDNGIFKGVPLTDEENRMTEIAKEIYESYPYDGKYILDGERLIICQSNAPTDHLKKKYPAAEINPLGEWTGGLDVDTGATNRKLGSDMYQSVTGGGINGKDLSKADVSVNIYAFLKAQELGEPVQLCCAIGDEFVDGKPYSEIVEIAKSYVKCIGGFEKLAEWGFTR